MKEIKKENTPTIETERLLLRKFNDSDIPEIYQIFSDEITNTFLPWDVFQSLEDAKKYLEESVYSRYQREIAYRYAIVLKEENRMIGYVSLGNVNEEEATGEIGYGVNRDYWGKGIASEATKAVLEKLRENGFYSIYATHDVENIGSGRVLNKVGMTYIRSYEEVWQPKNRVVTFHYYQIDFKNE